jgi:hypothetical protein
MSCSYSGDPSTSDNDAVRFLLQDTDCAKNIFEDEEIAWVLTQEANIYMTAACLLDTAINTSSGTLSSKKVGDLALSFGLSETRQRINDLRAKGRGRYELPSFPAQFRDRKRELREDPDRVQPQLFKEIHDIDRLRDNRDDFEEAQ